MLRYLIIMIASLSALACSMSMPETRTYSLHIPVDAAKAQTRKQAVITVKVQSPRYLTQPYIAHRLSAYQLDISRYAKWDSAPDEMVKEAFRDSLSKVYQDVRASNFVPEGSFVLNINLKRFERVDDGYAELMLDASLITSDSREMKRFEIDKKVQIETKDSAGLAKALSAALSDAVKEVVTEVNGRI